MLNARCLILYIHPGDDIPPSYPALTSHHTYIPGMISPLPTQLSLHLHNIYTSWRWYPPFLPSSHFTSYIHPGDDIPPSYPALTSPSHHIYIPGMISPLPTQLLLHLHIIYTSWRWYPPFLPSSHFTFIIYTSRGWYPPFLPSSYFTFTSYIHPGDDIPPSYPALTSPSHHIYISGMISPLPTQLSLHLHHIYIPGMISPLPTHLSLHLHIIYTSLGWYPPSYPALTSPRPHHLPTQLDAIPVTHSIQMQDTICITVGHRLFVFVQAGRQLSKSVVFG